MNKLNKEKDSSGNYYIPYGDQPGYQAGWCTDNPAKAPTAVTSDTTTTVRCSDTSSAVVSNRTKPLDKKEILVANAAVADKNAKDNSSKAPQMAVIPRAKPPDYEDAWYEESDGQFYNQYDWYQDEAGEWQYDYREGNLMHLVEKCTHSTFLYLK